MKQTKPIFCHHCGQQIVFNVTWPDKRNSHFAHAILVFNGKSHTLENALMEQRCPDRIHWATPRRNYKRSDCPICGATFTFPNAATAQSPDRICDDCATNLEKAGL